MTPRDLTAGLLIVTGLAILAFANLDTTRLTVTNAVTLTIGILILYAGAELSTP